MAPPVGAPSGALAAHGPVCPPTIQPKHNNTNNRTNAGCTMHAAVTSTHSLSAQAEQTSFDPAGYLLGVIQRVVANRQPALIYASGIGAIAIAPELELYITELTRDELAAFCRLPATQFKTKRMDQAEIRQLIDQGIQGRNLDELHWCAAHYVAQGRLMKGCGRDDVVLLKSWPNLTRLPVTPNGVRIAALLTRFPTTVSLAHRLLKIPVAEMNEFYSAAAACGIAVAVNRKPEQPPAELAPHRSRGLLSALFERVMGM